MEVRYWDILDKLGEPVWWNEHGVPRYCEFSVDEASIYAEQVALVRITCQGCGHPFQICMSSTVYDRARDDREDLETYIRATVLEETFFDVGDGYQMRREFGYGDPPNIGCCSAGPTMTSVPERILEFWRRSGGAWVRVPEFEVDVTPSWSKDDERPF